MDFELRHLRMAHAIAEIGTTTGAAKRIGVTQSALSQQLLDLEARLGERLFERTGRRMLPTRFGEGFLEKARAVLEESARMDAWISGRKLGSESPFRISVDQILTLDWLPRVLTRFRELHPEVGLRILRRRDPLEDLAAGRLDLAITPPLTVRSRAIESAPLFEDELVAVLPAGHPLARKRFLAPDDLNGQDLLYHMELRSSGLYRRVLAPRGVRLASATVIEHPDAIVELVRAGLGLSLLPRSSLTAARVGDLVVRPVSPRRGGYRIAWAAAFPSERRSPWVDEAVRLIRSSRAR